MFRARPGQSHVRSADVRADHATPVADFGHARNEIIACRVCGRTLLMGERTIGFFQADGSGPYDVCELCVPRAPRLGLRSHPSSPDELRRRHTRTGFGFRRRASRPAAAVQQNLGGNSPMGTAAVPLALAAFNASAHARTLAGLYKTLGAPTASVVPRSPTDREVILTVAWEIVWYQFQIRPDGIEQTRGTYLSELPTRWRAWNCAVSAAGQVAAPSPELSVSVPSGLTPVEVDGTVPGVKR